MDCGAAEECFEVSAADAAQLSGAGGGRALIEQRAGVSIVVENAGAGAHNTHQVRIRGPKAKVTKAKVMLRAVVSFREAAPPDETGICRWFAAGFCRWGERGADGCREGLHSAEAIKKSVVSWLNDGQKQEVLEKLEKKSGQPLLLALFCSGPGQRGFNDAEEEIVEFALVAVCSSTGKEVGRFHRFLKPSVWEARNAELRLQFAPACFNGEISAIAFTDMLADLLDWIPSLLGVDLDEVTPEDVLFVSARDVEIQMTLPRACNLPVPETVDLALQNFFFCRWACLKDVFRAHFSLPNEEAPVNLRAMLRHFGLHRPETGRFTGCMLDAACVSRVVQEILRTGWEPQATAWRDSVTAPTQFLLPKRGEFHASDTTVSQEHFLPPRKRSFSQMSSNATAQLASPDVIDALLDSAAAAVAAQEAARTAEQAAAAAAAAQEAARTAEQAALAAAGAMVTDMDPTFSAEAVVADFASTFAAEAVEHCAVEEEQVLALLSSSCSTVDPSTCKLQEQQQGGRQIAVGALAKSKSGAPVRDPATLIEIGLSPKATCPTPPQATPLPPARPTPPWHKKKEVSASSMSIAAAG